MDGIFISYRRSDSAGYAGRLYDRLAQHFGPERVFMDVEGIEPGTDFVVAIERAVGSCRVLIVLIGDEWLTITDAQGKRRLDDPHDFIRLETGAALTRDIRVVPVLLDGAVMPDADALPDDLKALVRRHAVELTHKQWDATSGELIHTLEKILAPPGADDASGARAKSAAPATPIGQRTRWPLIVGALVLTGLAVAAGLMFLRQTPHVTQPIGASPESATAKEPAAATAIAPANEVTSAHPPLIPAQLAATTPLLDFGTVPPDARRSDGFTVGNTGQMTESVTSRIDGADAAQFTIVTDTCVSGLVGAGNCEYRIAYRPQTSGEHRARLHLETSNSSLDIELKGKVQPDTANVPAVAPAPQTAPPPVAAAVIPEPALAPVISDLKVASKPGAVTLCYRADNAESVLVTPGNLKAKSPKEGCLDVPLTGPTQLMVTARNATGQTRRAIDAAPLASETTGTQGSAQDRLLPRAGDQWTYRLQGKWANSPRRTVTVTVDKVVGAVIHESMVQTQPAERPGGRAQSSNATPVILGWTWLGWEFSPWLATSTAIGDAKWSGFHVPDVGAFWTNWRGEAKVVGRESVSVPAGTFEAIKVQVLAQRRQSGSQTEAETEPVQTKLTVWYSPRTKRYVKMERIVDAASGTEIERDQIELVRYKAQ